MMKKKYTRSLLLAASLFLLPSSYQGLLAADLTGAASTSLDKANSVNKKAKATLTSEKKKVSNATASASKLSKIDLNSANIEQLSSIKGIGSKTAQAIVDYRKKYGAFTNLKDLVNVKGIGASTLKKIMPYLSL